MGPSSVTFRIRRSDGVFDEGLAVRLVEVCLAGGCDHVYTSVSDGYAPLRFVGLDDRYEGDGTMIGYGGITGFNHQIAEVLAPIGPVGGLDCSVGEHGVVLHLGTVEPDHRQLQTVLEVVRPVLRPLTLGVSWIAMPNMGNYATEHVRVALDHMRTIDDPQAERARREFPDVLEHYNRLLDHD